MAPMLKRVKFRRTWKTKKRSLEIRRGLSEFQKEFRTQMANFITGAFSFVAALLWRDAIVSFMKPGREFEIISALRSLYSAVLISAIAIVVIVIISHVLRVKK